MNTLLLRNRSVSKILCSSEKKKESPISISRKQFEKKRNVSLKENVNKLLAIASGDVKEYSEFFKELDDIHKKELGQFIDKVKANFSKSQETSVIDEDDENDENIFTNK